MWNAFTTVTFSTLIEKKLEQIETERNEVAKREVDTLATFWSNKEAWMACQQKMGRLRGLENDKDEWNALHEQMVELEVAFQQATSKAAAEKVAKTSAELFQRLERKLIPDCLGYGESARSLEYRFVAQLFEHVIGEDLDSLKTVPTLETWYNFYQGLKPEVVNEQFALLYDAHRIPPEEQEDTKKYCLHMLHEIRNLVKKCREREWDLLFVSEFGRYTMDERWIKSWWKEKIATAVAKRFPAKATD